MTVSNIGQLITQAFIDQLNADLAALAAAITTAASAAFATAAVTDISGVGFTSRPLLVAPQGYSAAGDGGGGPMLGWFPGDSTAVDNFLVFQPPVGVAGRYKRLMPPGIAASPKWGGCGLGAADDSAQMIKVMQGASAVNASGCVLPLQEIHWDGTYACTRLYSDGTGQCTNPVTSTASSIMFYVSKNGSTVEGLYFNLPISTTATPPTYDRAVYVLDQAQRVSVRNNYFIGAKFGPYFSGQTKYCVAEHNWVTQTWGQGISWESPYHCSCTDNFLFDGGYNSSTSSGGIRIGGIGTQLATIDGMIISRNHVQNWNAGFGQEAIDVSCQACYNLKVSENVIGAGNGGIEMKSGPSVLVPNIYQNAELSDNVIEMLGTIDGTSGIDCHMAVADASSKMGKLLIANNRIWCQTAPASGTAIYGIIVTCYQDVEVVGNQVDNVTRGIYLSIDGVSTDNVAKRISVKSNQVRAVDFAVYITGGGVSPEIQDFDFTGNTLTVTAAAATAFSATSATLTRPVIMTNRIIAEGATAVGMEIRGCFSGRITKNDIVTLGSGTCILAQGVAGDSVDIFDNYLESASGNACNIATGTNFFIHDNRIKVASNAVTAIGAAAPVTYNNIRGVSAASPASTAGALGDVFTNSAVSFGAFSKWVCTTAGNTSTTVWSGADPLGLAPPNLRVAASVNFNSANTDNALSMRLPPGYTRYIVREVWLSGFSAIGTTATCGLFTSTGGGGTAIVTGATAITVSTAAESTANNAQLLAVATGNTESFNNATLQFRVQNAQGSACTGTVSVIYEPLS